MTSNQLHSLDALLLEVRDPESKRLTQEAVTAYYAGAFRAAILSIWVAVCADIISKLRELAVGGDAAARAEITQLDAWITIKDLKHLQQFENGIVELSRVKFEMLLPHEAVDLERLKDDRNLCAHPAFVSDDALFSPTGELARAHIVHAILHLLSRPPVQGRQLITRYERDLFGGSFPTKVTEIEVVLRQNYLTRAKPGSVVSMVKGLAKALVGTESEKFKGKERQIANSLSAIGRIAAVPYEEHLPPLIEKMGREIDDVKVLSICFFINTEPRIWEWLGDAGRARICAKIQQAPFLELVPSVHARHVSEIGERLLARLKTEEPKRFETIMEKYPCHAFVPEALRLYADSGSFATAESRGEGLLFPHAKYLKVDDISTLNTAIRDNDHDQILCASQTATILIQVFNDVLNLLPAAAPHWTAIAEYIVDRKQHGRYEYPRFLDTLRAANVPVP